MTLVAENPVAKNITLCALEMKSSKRDRDELVCKFVVLRLQKCGSQRLIIYMINKNIKENLQGIHILWPLNSDETFANQKRRSLQSGPFGKKKKTKNCRRLVPQ